MLYEAVLMDMDGVLIDTQQSILAFWQRVASTYHVHLTQEDIDQHISGCSALHTMTTLLPPLDEPEQLSLFRDLHEYEASLSYQEVRGAIALLREFKRRHIPVALVTGAGQWKVDVVLQQLDLEPLFAVRVTGDDVQASKPAPDGYMLAAHRLGKEPQACVVFEDAVNGVLAALAARTVCIGIRTTAPACALLAAGAACIIPDFTAVRIQGAPATTPMTDAGLLLEVENDFCFSFKSSC
jgi:HAD superfamily hydrolase (TIGR01509 family)